LRLINETEGADLLPECKTRVIAQALRQQGSLVAQPAQQINTGPRERAAVRVEGEGGLWGVGVE
jgi:hypothetical protein